MLGDYHVEVVETPQTIELYPSDAVRRPLEAVAGFVSFDGADAQSFERSGDRLVAVKPAYYAIADYRMMLEGDVPLTLRMTRADLMRLLVSNETAAMRRTQSLDMTSPLIFPTLAW